MRHAVAMTTCLEGLDEGPQQRADALASTQQLHKAHHSEQSEEVDADDVGSLSLRHRHRWTDHSWAESVPIGDSAHSVTRQGCW